MNKKMRSLAEATPPRFVIPILAVAFAALSAFAQGLHAQPVSTNRVPVGLETNILFNATYRYTVTQSGPAPVSLETLFDGRFPPTYSGSAPSDANPHVIEIANLPEIHTQSGAWFGFTTRAWPVKRFKVEGYNTWSGGTLGWRTLFDYSQTPWQTYDFFGSLPEVGSFTKLRITIYESHTSASHGKYGFSEIYFLHPEATRIYSGILPVSMWEVAGKVGIGVKNPQNTLDVNGTIRAKEVIVESGWADHVFADGYALPSLGEVEAHIISHRRLPGIPSAAEVQANGLSLSASQTALMAKVEELTLYAIAQERQLADQSTANQEKDARIAELEQSNINLSARLSAIESLLRSREN